MSTAQDLALTEAAPRFGEPSAGPALRLVPLIPLDFEDAVSRVRPRLHRYAIRRLGDVHEAEELVQEALLRAYTHREQLLTEEDLSAWTTVVTGRLVIDRLRVRGRSTTMADVPETARIGRDTADVVVARDEARTALDALDAMPARQASLLWAREVEGRSYEELCERFAMTEPAVRSVLTRARKALRREYALRGGTLPVGGLAILAPWITGLTFADKLRRAATRLTAPAALGAVGITALGGLILSPFGVAPADRPTFAPSPAVTSSHAAEPQLLHPTIAIRPPMTSRSRTAQAELPPAGSPAKPSPFGFQGCIGTESGAAAGSRYGTCSATRPTTGATVYLNAPLPANPLGLHYVGVKASGIECSSIPNQPVLACAQTPDSGATQ